MNGVNAFFWVLAALSALAFITALVAGLRGVWYSIGDFLYDTDRKIRDAEQRGYDRGHMVALGGHRI